MNLKDKIRIIQDFPKSGISLKILLPYCRIEMLLYRYSLVNACKEWNRN